MYTLWHVLYVSLYIPLSSKFCVVWWVLCLVLWSIVLVLLNAFLVFVCLFEEVGNLRNFSPVIREGGPFPASVIFSWFIRV
jgi:hypothetical protein